MRNRDIILRMLLDEIEENTWLKAGWAASMDDLDDMQAEWAAESEAWYRGSDRTIVQCQEALTNQRLRHEAEIAELKAGHNILQTMAVLDLQTHDTDIEQLRTELAEAHRQKVAAFERNAELEREMKSCAQTLRAIVTEGIANPDLSGLAKRLDPPRAPSVPRRQEFIGRTGEELEV